MRIDPSCLYGETHEWIKKVGEEYLVGISDWAQDNLGDLVFIELPKLDTELTKGSVLAVVESVKAASELYCPLDGRVVAINTALVDNPSLLNTDPYGAWIIRVAPRAPVEDLMDAVAYGEFCKDL